MKIIWRNNIAFFIEKFKIFSYNNGDTIHGNYLIFGNALWDVPTSFSFCLGCIFFDELLNLTPSVQVLYLF